MLVGAIWEAGTKDERDRLYLAYDAFTMAESLIESFYPGLLQDPGIRHAQLHPLHGVHGIEAALVDLGTGIDTSQHRRVVAQKRDLLCLFSYCCDIVSNLSLAFITLFSSVISLLF